jgi:hypothetical protein
LYKVITVEPLTVQVYGQTDTSYVDIVAVDSHMLVAVYFDPPCVHLVNRTGKLIRDVTLESASHTFRYPVKVTSENSVVAVMDRNYDDHWLVVCMDVSGRALTYRWTSKTLPETWDIGMASGVVLVTCTSPNAIIALSVESGRRLQYVSVTERPWSPDRWIAKSERPRTPNLGAGICVYEDKVFVGCNIHGSVAQLKLFGRLLAINPTDM